MREKNKDKLKTVTLHIRLNKQQLELIDKVASKNYRTRADEIRKMIDEYTNKNNEE